MEIWITEMCTGDFWNCTRMTDYIYYIYRHTQRCTGSSTVSSSWIPLLLLLLLCSSLSLSLSVSELLLLSLLVCGAAREIRFRESDVRTLAHIRIYIHTCKHMCAYITYTYLWVVVIIIVPLPWLHCNIPIKGVYTLSTVLLITSYSSIFVDETHKLGVYKQLKGNYSNR